MAGPDDQRQMLAIRARTEANGGACDAPAPSDDRGRIGDRRRLGMSKNRGAANESRRQGKSRSTPHLFLRNVG
jgi:hypothetical protein